MVFLAACQPSYEEEAADKQGPVFGDRVYQQVPWDTVLQLGGFARDTLLLIPEVFTVQGGLLYVFDYGDHQLKAFDSVGQLRWITGREGRGPGEFINVIDLEVDSGGDLWVMDGGAGRINVFSATGVLERIILVEGELLRDLLPLPDQTLATSYSPAPVLWVEIDSTGQVQDQGRLPLDDLIAAFPMSRQTESVISDSDPETWLTIFPFGNVLLIYEGKNLRCHGRLRGSGEFPTEPYTGLPPVWAVAAALSDSMAFVLPKGESNDALRVIDQYSAETCQYVQSLRLPREFRAMALDEGVFYLEFDDASPTILGLRIGD